MTVTNPYCIPYFSFSLYGSMAFSVIQKISKTFHTDNSWTGKRVCFGVVKRSSVWHELDCWWKRRFLTSTTLACWRPPRRHQRAQSSWQKEVAFFVVDFVPNKIAQKRRREGEAKRKVKIHLSADRKRASNGRDGFTSRKTDAGPLDISPVNISICIGHL